MRFQTCNDKVCIPPRRRTVTATLTIDPAAHAAAPFIPAGYAEVTGPPKARTAPSAPASPDTQSLGAFLLVAFGVGLAAIFTPCVFPMIPITMSFFLNRQGTRREGVFHAVLFCLGIVVLFSGLGLITTAILGPFGVVQLGIESLGERFHRAGLSGVRVEPAGRIRDHHPLVGADQPGSGHAEGRHRGNAC